MKDSIQKIIEDIFKHTGCVLSKCEFSEEAGMFWCEIDTPDSRFLIGKDGENLKSLNYLIHRLVEKNHGEDSAKSLIIDINGYQRKKLENLKATAYMMAERARYFKSNIEIDPMSAFERRIIHLFLENSKDIKTESTGFGPNRRVVIKYIANS